MTTITITKHIDAPKEQVFNLISDIRNFSEAVPEIIEVEFLSEQEYGVGTTFRETRDMNGRKASTILEVTELKENDHIRLVSDAGGTKWDSVFTVSDKEGGTELILEMEAKPYKLMAKVVTPFMKGFMRNALERDMIEVKAYCERDKE